MVFSPVISPPFPLCASKVLTLAVMDILVVGAVAALEVVLGSGFADQIERYGRELND